MLCGWTPFQLFEGSPYAVYVHNYMVIDWFCVGYFESRANSSLAVHLCRQIGFHELHVSHSTSCVVVQTSGIKPLASELARVSAANLSTVTHHRWPWLEGYRENIRSGRFRVYRRQDFLCLGRLWSGLAYMVGFSIRYVAFKSVISFIFDSNWKPLTRNQAYWQAERWWSQLPTLFVRHKVIGGGTKCREMDWWTYSIYPDDCGYRERPERIINGLAAKS